ncbi:unnamed protein product [Musa hybrid cultivar]
MEKEIVARLEAAVARLEALAAAGSLAAPAGVPDAALAVDPAVVAFDELVERSLGRLSAAADKIGGKVQEATKILAEAFAVLKELLVKAKQCQKPDLAGLQEFLKPLNEVILKASALTEGRRSEFFNHLKTVADGLTALAWVAYSGKDCGMNMPTSHVEECWQMAEFYNNKLQSNSLFEYSTTTQVFIDKTLSLIVEERGEMGMIMIASRGSASLIASRGSALLDRFEGIGLLGFVKRQNSIFHRLLKKNSYIPIYRVPPRRRQNKREVALKRSGLRLQWWQPVAAAIMQSKGGCSNGADRGAAVVAGRSTAAAVEKEAARVMAGWAASGVVAGWAAVATVVATGVRSSKGIHDCGSKGTRDCDGGNCPVSVTTDMMMRARRGSNNPTWARIPSFVVDHDLPNHSGHDPSAPYYVSLDGARTRPLQCSARRSEDLPPTAFRPTECFMSLHVQLSSSSCLLHPMSVILVEYRNKDANHVEWAKALKELYLPSLRSYVKSFYPLGLTWGSAGSAVVCSSASAPSVAKDPPSQAPVPPPPPSASLFTSEAASSRPKEGISAVFQEIGSSKSNRADRSSVVAVTEKGSRANSFSFRKEGPPKLELQMGRKWAVENQISKKNLVIDDCDSKQTVYAYGCKDSVLQVKGKVNNITVDKCTKMGIVFMDVVAACEIVNCNGVEVQCQGSAPTISVDNTSGCQLYLSKDSLGASITTAKSSEINVMVPGAGPESDWVEHALPQQFVHTFKNSQFTTSAVSHSGG